MGQLEFGMYIAELDRPWTDTPFMFQGFHLRSDQQLETLKKFCKHVFVDMEKTEVEDRSRPRAPAPRFKIRGSTAYPETVNVENEVKRAAPVYTQTVAAVHELARAVQGGDRLFVRAVDHAIELVLAFVQVGHDRGAGALPVGGDAATALERAERDAQPENGARCQGC